MPDSTLSLLTDSTPGTAGLLYTVQGGADRKMSMSAAGAAMIEAASASAQAALLTALLAKAGGTMTGALVNSTNGAASTPALALTGTPFTGGSATTTKPLALIETTGATSNNWSTGGTMLGVNAPSGFAGNLLSLQTNGSRMCSVTSDGTITVAKQNVAAYGVEGNNTHGLGSASGGCGLYSNSTMVLQALSFATGVTISDNISFGWRSGDVLLHRDAAAVFAQRNGANPQTIRVYGTYTDASNYERLRVSTAAGAYVIKPEAAGTGTLRDLHISGLPTSNPGPGILWNNAGTPAIGT